MYSPATILVVDDSQQMRASISRGLRFAGYSVVEAAHAGLALSMLRSLDHRPSAIVSDCEMPGPSVTELVVAAERMKPPIPVLLVSGSAPQPRIQSLVEAGRAAFMEKPFEWDELLRRVRRVLGS